MSRQKPSIYQLANFKIDEVSLVDRGANQQRFVVIKRRADVSEDKEQQETAADAGGEAYKPPVAHEGLTSKDDAESIPDEQEEANVKSSQPAADLATLPDTLTLLRELVAALRAKDNRSAAPADMAKRIERLEKHFCLPNSMADETSPSVSDGHVWPFDLNASRRKA